MANSLKIHNTTLQDQVWGIFSEATRKVSKPVTAAFGIYCDKHIGGGAGGSLDWERAWFRMGPCLVTSEFCLIMAVGSAMIAVVKICDHIMCFTIRLLNYGN